MLHASSSAADTDFTVTLCDVFEDGTVNTIQDGIVRARYRDGLDRPSPIEPGRLYEYVHLDLFATSYVLSPRATGCGSMSPSSNFDRFDRNPNTGEPFGRGGGHGRRRAGRPPLGAQPSHVVLPVHPRG